MEQVIKSVTAKVFDVKESQVEVVYRLMGGMSNLMYVFTLNNEKYTFRIPGKNSEPFVNRVEEQENIKIIDVLDINNETLYFDVKNGYKIAKFVEGTPLSEFEQPQTYLSELAKVLHQVHESNLKAVADYAPYDRLEKYEHLVRELEFVHETQYEKLKQKFLSHLEFLNRFEKVICHNDSQISNWVVTDKKTYLLDWEFTGQNDPLYDVACVGNNDFELAIKFLPIYLGREPIAQEWKRMYLWRAFQCLQWHNVALYKDLIGLSKDLNLPFMAIAKNYLQKAEDLLTKANEF